MVRRVLRSKKVLVVAATGVVMAGSLAACGSGGSGGGSGYKVAVLTVGARTDGSFGNAWWDASTQATKQTGATVKWVGNLNTPNQYVSQGSSFASAGYDFVVLAHGGMLEPAEELAKQFPKVQFCVAPVPAPATGRMPANLCVIDVKQEIGAFRAGIVAGLATKTNVVGSNQGLPIPAVVRQVTAFQLGARCVNPKVKVLNTLTNNDTDPSVTRTAAKSQIRQGADVQFGATGTAQQGMFEAAKAGGTLAIGSYVDASSDAPTAVVATGIMNVQQLLGVIIGQAKKGPLPTFTSYGVDAPVKVGYLLYNKTLYASLPAGVRSENEAAQAKVDSGAIKIPDTNVLVNPKAGATIDPASLGCTPAS